MTFLLGRVGHESELSEQSVEPMSEKRYRRVLLVGLSIQLLRRLRFYGQSVFSYGVFIAFR
jgi:hypothetical protein